MGADVVILLTDDDKGLYSIYEESGQAIECDFESYEDAVSYAEDTGLHIIDTFNF